MIEGEDYDDGALSPLQCQLRGSSTLSGFGDR
jgi:hypothetical protein